MTLRYAWHKPPMKARDLGSVTQSEAKSLLFGRREKQILRPVCGGVRRSGDAASPRPKRGSG